METLEYVIDCLPLSLFWRQMMIAPRDEEEVEIDIEWYCLSFLE